MPVSRTRLVAVIVATTPGSAVRNALPVVLEREFLLPASVRGIVLGLPAAGSTTGALLTLTVAAVLPLVIVAIVLFGLGEGLSVPTLQELAASAGDASQRGTLVATQVGMARFGQTVGPLTLGGLAGAGDATLAFGAAGGLALLSLPLLATMATPAPTRAGTSA